MDADFPIHSHGRGLSLLIASSLQGMYVYMFCSILLVATNSLGLLVLVVSVLSLHLLDEGDVLLLGLVGAAVGILDCLFPGGLLCLALLHYEIAKVSWQLALSAMIFGCGAGFVV